MKILKLDEKPIINLEAQSLGQDIAINEFKNFSENILYYSQNNLNP